MGLLIMRLLIEFLLFYFLFDFRKAILYFDLEKNENNETEKYIT